MRLDRLIELFAGQNGDKHDLEVSLADLREWHAEIERLKADNDWLRKLIHNAIAAQDYNDARRALEQARKG